MPWESEITHTFRRSYHKLASQVRVRADEAMVQLLESEDPTKLGLRKVGLRKGSIHMKSADSSDYCTKSGSRTTPLSSMMSALTESTGNDATIRRVHCASAGEYHPHVNGSRVLRMCS